MGTYSNGNCTVLKSVGRVPKYKEKCVCGKQKLEGCNCGGNKGNKNNSNNLERFYTIDCKLKQWPIPVTKCDSSIAADPWPPRIVSKSA